MSSRVAPADFEDNSFVSTKTLRKASVVVSESFDWVASGGRRTKSDDISILLAVQSLLAAIFMFVPLMVAKSINQEITLSSLRVGISGGIIPPFDPLDIVRMSMSFGAGWLAFVITMTLTILVPKGVKALYGGSGKELSKSAQRFIITLKFLSPYISMTVGFWTASMLASFFYPGMLDFQGVFVEVHSKPEKDDISKSFNVFIQLVRQILKHDESFRILYVKYFFTIVVAFGAIFMTVLTLEKAILQSIAIHYRTSTISDRFGENEFAHSAFKVLYRSKLDREMLDNRFELGTAYEPELVRSLFEALVPDHENSNLTKDTLVGVLGEAHAVKLFHLLDISQNGDLNLEEFMSAVKEIHQEKETLARLITDHDDIIAKLDRLLMIGVYAIDIALCLTLMGLPGIDLYVIFLSLIVGLCIFFKNAVVKTFDSLVFVLVTHPFDLGDRIEVDGLIMYVETVGLWVSVYRGPDNLKVIWTNASMAHKRIANFRRSPSEVEPFTFLVRPESATDGVLAAFQSECMQFYQENRREYQPKWFMEVDEMIDIERLRIVVKVFHRSNFQDEEAQNTRSMKFSLFLKDAVVRVGLVLSPPMPRAIATKL